MPTLVLPPRHTPDIDSVRAAALSAGWQVERLPNWRAPAELAHTEVSLYGEPLFCAVVADSLELALLEAPFDWLTTVPSEFLRRRVQFATLGEARTTSGRAFIKPCDDKCFAARVYESRNALPTADVVSDSTPVLISEPVRWTVEFRSFVLEGELVAMSPYSREGELCRADDGSWPSSDDERTQAERFVSTLLADARVRIPPALVVDIGMIVGAGWAVIEANAAWGSAIYGCDPKRVLPVLRRACLRRQGLSELDSAWVVDRPG